MRKRWEQRQLCGQRCSALDKVMISPSVSKVNPFHLADFAALRDCSVAHPTCHNLPMCAAIDCGAESGWSRNTSTGVNRGHQI